jgi:hypothetical protein
MAQVEQVYGKARRILPPDPKSPNELYVYDALPTLILRVHFDKDDKVVRAEFIHIEAKYYPISAKLAPTPEMIEHDAKVAQRNLVQLRKKIRVVPWAK